jgi:hypothetical protein
MDFPQDLVDAVERYLKGFKPEDMLAPLRICEDVYSGLRN